MEEDVLCHPTIIDHLTLLCSFTRPMNKSEANELLFAKEKRGGLSIPASLLFKGLVTEHRTVKLSIKKHLMERLTDNIIIIS